jgi:hypothetical protein
MSKATLAMVVITMVLMAFCVMPVAASNADNDLYTSKYAATVQDTAKYGSIMGHLRAGMPGLTSGVNVTELATGIVTPLVILPDGTFEMTGLTPGRYLITIADGNGGQPEQAYVQVAAGMASAPESELLGHAVSPGDEPAVADVIIVERATYGMQKTVIDREAVPGIPAIAEVNHTVTHPAQTHQDYEAGHVHAKTVGGFSSHDFYYNGHKYQIVGNQAYDAFIVHSYFNAHPAAMVTIIDSPAHTHLIVDSPAVPAIPAVTELSHVEGQFIDVTAQVQQAIDGGAREFAFNNAMIPGGIVNVAQDTVLVAINDPAYGQVKSVKIQVTVNGALKTIDKMEYETITI